MRGGASLPRMMVERISTFEPGRSVGGFHQTLELGSIHVATFDEARRHFVDLALVLRQKFSGALVSVISRYVGLHLRKVYEQGCDLQMVSATSPAGQWMLKEIFRYITREGGRLAARVQKASVWSSAAQHSLIFDVPTIIFCRAAELPPRRRVPR
jgi:hypothetical protein